MALTLTDDQAELSASVRDLAAKRADLVSTRAALTALQAGEQGRLWQEIVDQGLHSIHLPEEAGGMGGTLTDLSVAVAVAGETLIPGAYVPTVFASAVALVAGADASVLERFAEGVRAAVITGSWSGTESDFSGESEPALGAMAAELLLVVAPHDGLLHILVVDAEEDGVSRRAVQGVDLTRDLGIVGLSGVSVTAAGTIGLSTYDALIGAVYGAEAAGIARAALASAVEYAHTRTQFGVPIGSFQATKHKAARMAIAAELAASAAWGAALSVTQSTEQRALAGGSAQLAALHRAADIVTDAVTIFGGIGFTWEHDIHFFLRRAISISGLGGAGGRVQSKLGEVALTARREVDVELPDEDPAFREEVGALLDQALALPEDEPRFDGAAGKFYARGARRRFLAEHGLVAPHWPKPWGREATPIEQIIVSQEFARRGLTQPTTVIGEWAMPTVLAHGTQEQKERLATPTLTADIVWCQLFSEPEAGSDLASLRTKATKVEGGWRLDGQKVWTSGAHQADWGICLARTDPTVPKHKGLSFFLVDMSSPGITVRPLRQSTGDDEFSEVFIDDVFVPDDCLVGQPGEGWRISLTTLQNERTSIGSSLSVGVEDGLRAAIEAGAYDDRGDALAALGRVAALSTAIGSLNLAETLRRLNGLEPGPGSSLAKVATAELSRAAAAEALGIAGGRAVLAHSPGEPVLQEMNLPQQLIGGGSIEIQLNVLAERVLGLPRG